MSQTGPAFIMGTDNSKPQEEVSNEAMPVAFDAIEEKGAEIENNNEIIESEIKQEDSTQQDNNAIIENSTISSNKIVDQDISPEEKNIEYKSNMFETKSERNAFIFFMIPIVIMSLVSMIHLVDFFSIGNNLFTSWLLGIALEFASLGTIVALVLLRKLKKATLWSILLLLYVLQLIGNVYAPFSFIDPKTAIRLFEFFGLTPTEISAQRIVSIIQGAIPPTIVVLLFKMTSSYLNVSTKNKE